MSIRLLAFYRIVCQEKIGTRFFSPFRQIFGIGTKKRHSSEAVTDNIPPSMLNACPVTTDASRLARYTTRRAISFGSRRRPIGVKLASNSAIDLEQMMYDWPSLGCQWFRRRIIKKGAGKAREKNRDRENLRSLSDEAPALQ